MPDEVIEALVANATFAAGAALIGRGVTVSLKREVLSKFAEIFPSLGMFDDVVTRINESPPKTPEEKRTIVRSSLILLVAICALYSKIPQTEI